MSMKKHNLFKYFPMMLLSVILLFGSCKDSLEDTVYRTSDVKMIDEYMEDSNNNLSDFLSIIDKADYRGMLHAYGTYTCFVPTNTAVQIYMKELGKTIDQLTQEEAIEIVGYHVVNDTIATQDFVDGRLSSPNIIRQYITTRTKADDAGNVYIEVDRKARVVTKDILLGNGYVHVVDAMLGKSTQTLAQKIAELPDRFSFMKDLFEEAEVYPLLSTVSAEDEIYYSVFMQDNQTFIDEGVETRDKLLVRLRENTPDITSDDELIRNFVLYHVVSGRKYLVDLMLASAINTLVSQQVLSFSMTKDQILINEYKVGQLNEEGIPVDRNSDYTDVSCSNGVMHEVLGILEIKKRPAYRVNFDLAEQPEIKALKTYRKNGASATFKAGELSEISWGGKNSPTMTYECYTNYDAKGQYIYGDRLQFRICTNVMQWCEFKLPLLVEGTYKVWLCWRRMNPATFRTTFKQEGEEDQVLPTVVDMSGYMPIKWADKDTGLADHDLMEQDGWKQYTAREVNSVMNCRLMGTIKVTSTGRHILRLDALSGSKGNGNPWDMIQFIPVDDDQIWPMLDMEGNQIEKGTPGINIYPYKSYSWETVTE